MRKITIKPAGLLLSAAGLSLATLATPRLAHALHYDGDYLEFQEQTFLFQDQVGPYYSLHRSVNDHEANNYISGSSGSGAVLSSAGHGIDLHTWLGGMRSDLYVGYTYAEHGGLIVENGSQLTTGYTTIGYQYLSQGWITVTGIGSKWVNNDDLTLGVQNNGTPPPGLNPFGSSGTIVIEEGGELHAYSDIHVGMNGNGTIHVNDGGVLTLGSNSSSSTMTIGSHAGYGLGILRVADTGRVQVDSSGPGSQVVFTEKATFDVVLSEGRANSPDAFVSATMIQIYQGAKLKVYAGDFTFNAGDEFILLSASSSLYSEGGGVPFAPDAISVYNNEQEFTLELQNGGLDLVLVAGAPIPEPSTYALIGGAGAVALALARRFKRPRR